MEKAVAVRYTLEMPAPIVLASGKGELARRICQIAQDHDIRILRMPELADDLIELEPGSWIPEEYFPIVAELLVFVQSQAAQRLQADATAGPPGRESRQAL